MLIAKSIQFGPVPNKNTIVYKILITFHLIEQNYLIIKDE
jgi:hypothetical protein